MHFSIFLDDISTNVEFFCRKIFDKIIDNANFLDVYFETFFYPETFV